MRADRILVIQAGSIIEQGTHSELIKKEGKYHSLWSKQVFFTAAEDLESKGHATELTQDESSEVGLI